MEDLIEGFKVIWFVINNFFVSFKISGGSYNLSQNTLRLIKEFEKCILSFILVHSVYTDNDLVLFHLWWKETRLTNKKSLKVFSDGLHWTW